MVSDRPAACAAARAPAAIVATLATCAAILLSLPGEAWAHAQLLGTSPAAGSTVPVQPQQVIFQFNQNVGGTLGAVRVYDAQGNEVDDLDVSHPNGDERWMGVGLKPHLPDGTYTATYRVISADTHIVYGGLVFNIGHAGPAPRYTVAGLIAKNRTGKVTSVAFGVVRTMNYVAIAALIGGLIFALAVWPRALAACARPDQSWKNASRAFASRLHKLLYVAVAVGLIASVLGVLLQGASAAGVSLWSSMKSSVIDNTLESRFGEVWAARAIDWALLGLVLAVSTALRTDAIPSLSDETGGKSVRVRRPPAALVALLALGCLYLAVTPALAGHASIESPTGLFFPADLLHVLAASVWVGGVACLLLALPAATKQLASEERARLLLATLARFSPIALASVLAIALTGAIQAYIDVRSIKGLTTTTYGALLIAKAVLLLTLIGLGWTNRERIIPSLRRIVGDGRAPGQTGVLARRVLRGELALMLSVFALTAALVSYAPPIDAASGPYSTSTSIGQADLQITVEPARAGLNTIHLYLIDAKTGAQYTATKELTVTARLPAKGIGPLPLKANVAGPGHYVLNSAVLSPAGIWSIEIVARVSEFEEHTRTLKVLIG
jgi:copper transport protein